MKFTNWSSRYNSNDVGKIWPSNAWILTPSLSITIKSPLCVLLLNPIANQKNIPWDEFDVFELFKFERLYITVLINESCIVTFNDIKAWILEFKEKVAFTKVSDIWLFIYKAVGFAYWLI